MTGLQLPGYRKLKVWQKAFELALLIQELADRFPPGNYRLADQMRGAAISVFGNIAFPASYLPALLPDWSDYRR